MIFGKKIMETEKKINLFVPNFKFSKYKLFLFTKNCNRKIVQIIYINIFLYIPAQ